MGQRLRTGLGRCLLLLLVVFAAAANAQMPGSYSIGATVTVSSNPTGPVGNIIDGLDNTQWQSGACFPTDYLARPSMNPLLNACAAAGRCSSSDGTTTPAAATDNNVYSGAGVALPKGTAAGAQGAFLRAQLPAAAPVQRASIKAFGKEPIDVLLFKADGSSVKAATLNPATDNYNWVHGDGSWDGIVAVQAQSAAAFTLTELGVQSGPCLEWATVDMGAVKDVGVVRARVWSPDSASAVLQASTDGATWNTLRALDPKILGPINTTLDTVVPARYLRVQHEITDKTGWKKVYVWGIDSFRGDAKPAPGSTVVSAVSELATAVTPKIPEKMGTWIPVYTVPGQTFDDLIKSVEANDCIKGSFKGAVLIGPDSGPPTPGNDKVHREYFSKIASTTQWTTFGYLHVGYGSRPLDQILKQIDTWLTKGPDGYGDIVQGIWVNQVAPTFKTDAEVAYMTAIIERIRFYNGLVALNPGRSMDCKLAGKADFVNAFEGTLDTWQKTNPVCACSDVTRCIASIHSYTGSASADGLAAVMAKARASGFEATFITDRRMPGQYDGLPSFWKEELQGLCQTIINP